MGDMDAWLEELAGSECSRAAFPVGAPLGPSSLVGCPPVGTLTSAEEKGAAGRTRR